MRVKPQAEKASCVNDFLDLARVRQDMRSDRELAQALQVGSPSVSGWRSGKIHPRPMTCMKLAELAELPLWLVLGIICETFAPTEAEAALWRRLAEQSLVARSGSRRRTPGTARRARSGRGTSDSRPPPA